VYKYRKAILYLVERHATTIVVGETGSGKSTQIPQVPSLRCNSGEISFASFAVSQQAFGQAAGARGSVSLSSCKH
jgi:ABC-type microcin C transport system duplicated ATPase subunit YejF